jgi:hypothetical protein
MFQASSWPSSGAYELQQQPLVYHRKVVVAVPLVVVGPAGRPDHDQQYCYHQAPKIKREAATAVDKLLMMGMSMPETGWAVFKRQAINLRNCCILLVDSFEFMKDSGCPTIVNILHFFITFKISQDDSKMSIHPYSNKSEQNEQPL